MMIPIYNPKIISAREHNTTWCNVFQSFSQYVWYNLADRHSLNLNWDERGITDDLVYWLKSHSRYIPGRRVIAQKAKNEKVDGNDIDLFIRIRSDQYLRFALQAKVLKKDKRYDSLGDGGTMRQWDKLAQFEANGLGKGMYLLYNGMNDFSYIGTDCAGFYSEEQFGCSLVEYKEIEAQFEIGQRPSFYDFHPTPAQPWRKLVCCSTKWLENLYNKHDAKSALTKYTLSDINADKNFEKVRLRPTLEKDVESKINFEILSDNNKDWNPAYRIIIDYVIRERRPY